jgi:hypothetical protein
MQYGLPFCFLAFLPVDGPGMIFPRTAVGIGRR